MDEEKKEKLFDFTKVKSILFNSLGYLAVFVTSAVYVLTAFLTIDETGKSVGQIIADGAICFIFGVLVNRSFSLQGLISGGKDDKVIAAEKTHQDMVYKISDRIMQLPAWCEKETKNVYQVQRVKILARAGLRYDEVFTEDGIAKPYPAQYMQAYEQAKASKNKRLINMEKNRLHGYEKAVGLKLTPLTANDLTTDSLKKDDPFYMGRTKAQFEKQTFLQSIAGKAGAAIIFGYYGVRLAENFDIKNLIWTLLQVCLFVMFGVVTMYIAYNYMTDEYKNRMKQKSEYLVKFDIQTERSVTDSGEKTTEERG